MLLEILIAFSLIVLCVLPLIYPHVFILKSEKKFEKAVELDHYVNLMFVDILQKLYRNEIPWSAIEGGTSQAVTGIELYTMDGKALPFEGTYHFEEEIKKVSKEKDHSAHIFRLIFSFSPKKDATIEKAPDSYVYKYRVVIEKGKAKNARS